MAALSYSNGSFKRPQVRKWKHSDDIVDCSAHTFFTIHQLHDISFTFMLIDDANALKSKAGKLRAQAIANGIKDSFSSFRR